LLFEQAAHSIQVQQNQTRDQQNGHHPRYREHQGLRRLVVTCKPLGLHGQSPIKTRGCGMSATPLAIIEYGSVSATRLTGRS